MPIPEIDLTCTSQGQLGIISDDLKSLRWSLVHKRLGSLFRLLIIVFSSNSKILEVDPNLRLWRVVLPCEMICLRSKVMMVFHSDITIFDIKPMSIYLLHSVVLVTIALHVIDVLTHRNIYYCLPHTAVCCLYSYVRLVLVAELWLSYLRHLLGLTAQIILRNYFFVKMMSILDVSSFDDPFLD